MSDRVPLRRSGTVTPVVRYDDAAAGIRWLNEVAGFETDLLVERDGAVEHAELWHGDGVIVVMSRVEFRPEKPVLPSGPAHIEITVTDVRVALEQALAAGGEVAIPLVDSVVGLAFTLRDPEGNLWTFGRYRPGTFVGS